jgi:hypothetical protein
MEVAEAHAALECRECTTMEIGRSRIILGRVVAIYVEDRYVDPAGPYIKADELHAIGRMNGLGNYVRTRDAFMTIPRVSYERNRYGGGRIRTVHDESPASKAPAASSFHFPLVLLSAARARSRALS